MHVSRYVNRNMPTVQPHKRPGKGHTKASTVFTCQHNVALVQRVCRACAVAKKPGTGSWVMPRMPASAFRLFKIFH